MAVETRDALLNFHLPSESKRIIEEAAASLGQSVDDFAVGALVDRARAVIERRDATVLSDRDRDRVLALLDEPNAVPNAALVKAAERYGRRLD